MCDYFFLEEEKYLLLQRYKFGYNQSNLTKGKCGRDAEKKVRKYLEYELANLRLEEVGELVGEIECLEK